MVDGERRGDRLRWGLIPFFARGIPPKYSTTNARIDTVQTCSELSGTVEAGPTVPCSGVRILRVAGQADGKSKIPFYIHTNDQEIVEYSGAT
jgi:putative SOS response-associated peptidase YedK